MHYAVTASIPGDDHPFTIYYEGNHPSLKEIVDDVYSFAKITKAQKAKIMKEYGCELFDVVAFQSSSPIGRVDLDEEARAV